MKHKRILYEESRLAKKRKATEPELKIVLKTNNPEDANVAKLEIDPQDVKEHKVANDPEEGKNTEVKNNLQIEIDEQINELVNRKILSKLSSFEDRFKHDFKELNRELRATFDSIEAEMDNVAYQLKQLKHNGMDKGSSVVLRRERVCARVVDITWTTVDVLIDNDDSGCVTRKNIDDVILFH